MGPFNLPDVWMTLDSKAVDALERAIPNQSTTGQLVAILKERTDYIDEELSLSHAEYAAVYEGASNWKHGYQDVLRAIVRCAERCA